ncbi:transposable element Tcb1 transposase [Trichonephila clavipes]|nr:transposable element Tcb1 transposase [Trichonephila clavipes]
MMEAGWSARREARQLRYSDCVVRRCWEQWIREMSFTQRPGSGRPRQTSRPEDHHITRGERLNPTFALQRHIAPTDGVMLWGTIAYNTR